MLTVILAVLSALGVLTLLWLLLGFFLSPLGEDGTVLVTLRLRGDAEGLEHSLRALGWLRESGLLAAEVCLKDDGLTEQGRERVQTILNRFSATILCTF